MIFAKSIVDTNLVVFIISICVIAFFALAFIILAVFYFKTKKKCILNKIDDDDIERANGELGYIEETTGKEIEEPSEEEILQIAREYKIPIGIDERLLNFAQRRWEQSMQNNDETGVKYYQEIVEAFSDEA